MVREKNQNTEYDLFHFTCLTVERTAASLSLEKRKHSAWMQVFARLSDLEAALALDWGTEIDLSPQGG